jgi:hypothetical protein
MTGRAAQWLDLVGGALVAPRTTAAEVAGGEAALGAVSLLLAIKVVVDGGARLARALLGAPALGALAAVQGIVQTAASALPDLMAILVGAVALALLGGSARGRRGRELDLAALAWVPYLAVRSAAALAHAALGHPPGALEDHLIDGVAVGWSLAVWAIGLRAWREAAKIVEKSA